MRVSVVRGLVRDASDQYKIARIVTDFELSALKQAEQKANPRDRSALFV